MNISVLANEVYPFVPALKEEFPTCSFTCGKENLENADIIWGYLPATKLKSLPKLKWLQLAMAGADAYKKELCPHNLLITTASGAYTYSIAEYMLAGHMALYRNLHLFRDLQRKHIWDTAGPVRTVKGCTVLIYGMGSIGMAYAELVKGMGATVIAIRRKNSEKPACIDEIYLADDETNVKKAFSRADVVAITAPGTSKTANLFNDEVFASMKTSSILINVGRGSIVDMTALMRVLTQGKLSGAVLDVVTPEPLPQDHPLWDMDNVILTNHNAGGYGLAEIEQIKRDIFSRNLKRYLANEPLENVVDITEGY